MFFRKKKLNILFIFFIYFYFIFRTKKLFSKTLKQSCPYFFFLGLEPAWHIHGQQRNWFGTSDSNGVDRLAETPTVIKFLPISVSFPPNFSLEPPTFEILILNTRVSGTNGHLILSPESLDRQLSLFSLLISPSKLSSFELSFTSNILQHSETPFYKTLKYLTHLQLR